jgi:predicted CopG family antitoxin
MTKKLTITIADEVYEGLYRHVGKRRISRFLEALARPHVIDDDLEAAYQSMAADEVREIEAEAWGEAVLSDVADEPR